jgi:hypothetical protein
MLHLLAEPRSPRDLDLGATPEKRNFLGCGGEDECDSVQLIRWLAKSFFSVNM